MEFLIIFYFSLFFWNISEVESFIVLHSCLTFSYLILVAYRILCMIQVGFVNSLAFANSGQFLIAGVGQVRHLSLT